MVGWLVLNLEHVDKTLTPSLSCSDMMLMTPQQIKIKQHTHRGFLT